jgi:GntR family transcriptional regulator, L-lactate dehydrogenase operon regulator
MSLAVDVVFRPIRTGNTFEETVERLLHAIKLGVVTAGERLPAERELALRLGVSRATLRDAIRELEQAGYVESRRGRSGGTFVIYQPTPGAAEVVASLPPRGSGLEDALTLRSVLELGAAETAARRDLSDDERRHLTDRLADCDAADRPGYRQLDSRLHLAIAEVTGSTSLAAAVADVRMRINDLLDQIPVLAPNIEHSRVQHRILVAAILAGDPVAARAAAEEHLGGTAALLRGFLT